MVQNPIVSSFFSMYRPHARFHALYRESPGPGNAQGMMTLPEHRAGAGRDCFPSGGWPVPASTSLQFPCRGKARGLPA